MAATHAAGPDGLFGGGLGGATARTLVQRLGVAVLAALAVGVYILTRRRNKSKAGGAQAQDGPVQIPPAPADPVSAPPAPEKDEAASSPAPASPVSAPPAQAQDDSATTETPPESTKFCTKCGGVIEPGKRFCGDCGAGID